MASNLSEEEFHRLQEQLIELRTTNYSLDEQCRKLKQENQGIMGKLEGVEKELGRACKTISRSKKIKEVESLLAENHSLQMKLQAQEDEFRLQNQTLLHELSLLVSSNEELERQVSLAQQRAAAVPTVVPATEVVIGQQALANQQLRTELEASAEKGISSLRETIQILLESDKPSNNDNQPRNASSEEGEFVELHNAEISYQKHNSSLAEPLKTAQEKIEALEIDLKEMIGVRLMLETERKEKQQVLCELSTCQASEQELQTKLASKQASLAQLHQEKEQLYLTSKKQYEELEIAREVEVRGLREQTQRLQTQLNNCKAVLQESKDRVIALETALSTAHQQGTKEVQVQLVDMQSQLQSSDTALVACRQLCGQLEQQLSETSKQARSLQVALDEGATQLQEATKVSEKRKKLLDEMSICLQQKTDELRKQQEESIQEYEKITTDLKNELSTAELEFKRLHCVEKDLEEARVTIASLEARLGWLERRQHEAEQSNASTRTFLESVIEQLKEEHTREKQALVMESSVKEEKLLAELEEARELLQAQVAGTAALQMQVNDAAEERRLVEKKGSVVNRDLRRQLAAERKRAEKLQERLRDLVSENKGNTSIDTNHKAEGGGKDADTSSISSWSIMSGTMEPRGGSSTREGSLVAGSPTNGNENVVSNSTATPAGGDEANLEQENLNLVTRITALQQEKWILEEKINHLEEGSAAMVDDLMQKSAVIEFYCMEGGRGSSSVNLTTNTSQLRASRRSIGEAVSSPERLSGVISDKLSSMKKLKDLLKPSNYDEYSHDSHKRMQRMLEETLTKNMHLQNDLEKLSQEVERLSNINTDGKNLNTAYQQAS